MTVGQDLARAYLAVVAGKDAGRQRWLDRGRRGAGHHVDALRIEPGRARLRVPSARGRSPEVVVSTDVLEGEDWEQVIDVAGANLRSTAELLAGRLPADLARPELLVPAQVDARCSGDAGQCRHEAIAHHVIAVAIERDPFRLLQWRGHRRQDLLAALRRVRGATGSAGDADVDLSQPFRAGGPLDLLVHPRPPDEVTGLLDRLGPPPGIEEPFDLEDAVAAAADMAWRLAAGEGTDVADDEVLLSELRAQRVTSAERLADALGLDLGVVTDHLDRLYADGAVLRMGSGDGARYRAA